MALTDKSAIPLSVHDLRVVEGKRCFLDRRLAQRLGYASTRFLRNLIKRNKDDFERRFGQLIHRESVVHRAQRGTVPETEFWLTKGQALWVCRKSDARNADDVMEEVIKVFLAVDAGIPIPNTPWTDALFAPDAPKIERGDDNVVHVKHEKPLTQQRESSNDADLFELPPVFRDLGDYMDADAPLPPRVEEEWQHQYEGKTYLMSLRSIAETGTPLRLRIVLAERIVGVERAMRDPQFMPPNEVGERLLVRFEADTPRAVIDAALIYVNPDICWRSKETLDALLA